MNPRKLSPKVRAFWAQHAECDDWCDSNEGYEYWADAEDSNGNDGKMAWRVHIVAK